MNYPEAIKYLLPIDSPMIAHAKKIRNEYWTKKVKTPKTMANEN